jgi:hypothetical protein
MTAGRLRNDEGCTTGGCPRARERGEQYTPRASELAIRRFWNPFHDLYDELVAEDTSSILRSWSSFQGKERRSSLGEWPS